MTRMASQITSLAIVYSTVYSGADQSKHQSSASLAFVWEIHRGPVNFPHKWPVTQKMFPFDDIIMAAATLDNLVNMDSGKCLSAALYQAITWTNDGLLLIRTLVLNFSKT